MEASAAPAPAKSRAAVIMITVVILFFMAYTMKRICLFSCKSVYPTVFIYKKAIFFILSKKIRQGRRIGPCRRVKSVLLPPNLHSAIRGGRRWWRWRWRRRRRSPMAVGMPVMAMMPGRRRRRRAMMMMTHLCHAIHSSGHHRNIKSRSGIRSAALTTGGKGRSHGCKHYRKDNFLHGGLFLVTVLPLEDANNTPLRVDSL